MMCLALMFTRRVVGLPARGALSSARRPARGALSTAASNELFNEPLSRAGTDSRKWSKFGADVVPMWVADADFATAEPISRAISARAAHAIYGYTDASPALKTALALGVSRSWSGKRVEEGWIRFHPGLIPGLYHAARLAGAEGAVVVPTPIYPPFLNAARDSSTLIELQLESDGLFDAGALEAALDAAVEQAQGGDVVLLWCNPHNPSGRVWRRDELQQVAEMCRKRKAILLSDEVWSGVVLNDAETPFVSMGDVVQDDQLFILLTSPSKTYNVAALNFAFAVVPNDDLRRDFCRNGRDQAEISPFGYAAAEAIFVDEAAHIEGPPRADVLTPQNGACEAWRLRMVKHLQENRDACLAALAPLAPHLKIPAVPEASYLLWIDATALGVASPALHFEKFGVGLTDGAAFGRRGFVRLNFACTRETLDKGLGRIRAAVQAAAEDA
ncbi:pyridoxal phosphate-dependent transferase [Pelagophyceae sp. CCMP2097]|nr:pyridoxal phosphate-dependent transferase [Pelagophyceae sp. CCMP2097]